MSRFPMIFLVWFFGLVFINRAVQAKDLSVYVGGSFEADIPSSNDLVSSFADILHPTSIGSGVWEDLNAPLFSSAWGLSVTSSSSRLVVGGAINGIKTEGGTTEEVETGIVIARSNDTEWEPLRHQSGSGPSSFYTRSVLLVEDDCLASVSPLQPQMFDSQSMFLYWWNDESWHHASIECDLSSCDGVAVWPISIALLGETPHETCPRWRMLWQIEYISGSASLMAVDTSGTWTALIDSSSSVVESISWVVQDPINGNLYIGGQFSQINGVFARNVAFWCRSDRTWRPMGEGVPSSPVRLQLLTVSDRTFVLISGNFDNLCQSGKSATTSLWEILPGESCDSQQSKIIPLCGPQPEVPEYVPLPLAENEVLVDQFFDSNAICYVVVSQQDPLAQASPYIRFLSSLSCSQSSEEETLEWSDPIYPSVTEERDTFCPFCSIFLIDPLRAPLHEEFESDGGALALFSTATYPDFPSISLTPILPPCLPSTSKNFPSSLIDWDNNSSVLLDAVFQAEVITMVEIDKEKGLIVGGLFGSAGSNFSNLIYRHKNSWRGVGNENGIRDGAIYALATVKRTLYVGGCFTVQTRLKSSSGDMTFVSANLVVFENTDELESNQWQPFPGLLGDNELKGQVSCLTFDSPYLFIGGTFTLTLVEEKKTIHNFAIWNCDESKWEIDFSSSGIQSGMSELNEELSLVGVGRLPSRVSVVKTFTIISDQLIIGGFFNTTISGNSYSSLARLDIETLTWMPIGGLVSEQGPGVVMTVQSHTDDDLVYLFVGGQFSSSLQSDVWTDLFNTAKCQLEKDSDGLLLSIGCLSDDNFANEENQWSSMGGGVDSWIADLATWDNNVLAVGNFHRTIAGRPLFSVCPLMRYEITNDIWEVVLTESTHCPGYFLVAATHETPFHWEIEFGWVIGGICGFLVLILLIWMGYQYWSHRKDLKRKYGYQEVDRVVIDEKAHSSQSDFSEEDFNDPPPDEVAHLSTRKSGDYGSIQKQGSRPSVLHRCPYKIRLSGVTEVSKWSRSDGGLTASSEGNRNRMLFTVEVRVGMKDWEIHRSTQDFKELHGQLTKSYPSLALPPFPTVPSGKMNDMNQMLKSRPLFEEYIKRIVRLMYREGRLQSTHSQIRGQSSASASSVVVRPQSGGNIDYPPPSLSDLGVMPGGDDVDLDANLQKFLFRGRINRAQQLETSWEIAHQDVLLQRSIGHGTYAEVYEGEWKGVKVAVKKLSSPSGQSWDPARLAASFREEVGLMSKLHHPNILRFYGACTRAPNFMIVTEWMCQGDLFHIIQNPQSPFVNFTLSTRLKMGLECAIGIEYLHSLVPAVLHRDLKSLNILVNERWDVKIADFGLSQVKAIFDDSSSHPVVGTAAWGAPEVLRGEKATEKADVFSFGVILWELGTKSQPYPNMKAKEIMASARSGLVLLEIPKDLPDLFQNLLSLCLDHSPEKRPFIGEVVERLQYLLTPQLVASSPSGLYDNVSYSLDSGSLEGSLTKRQMDHFSLHSLGEEE